MTPGIFGTWKGEGKPDPAKCKARVSDHDTRWPHYYQCKSKPSLDGWCGRHHPDKLEAKAKVRDTAAKRQRAYSDYLYQRKERRNKIADAAIEGRFQDMKMLVDEFKDFETKKPPAVSLPAWERGAF